MRITVVCTKGTWRDREIDGNSIHRAIPEKINSLTLYVLLLLPLLLFVCILPVYSPHFRLFHQAIELDKDNFSGQLHVHYSNRSAAYLK